MRDKAFLTHGGMEDGHLDPLGGGQTHWEDETHLPAAAVCLS